MLYHFINKKGQTTRFLDKLISEYQYALCFLDIQKKTQNNLKNSWDFGIV